MCLIPQGPARVESKADFYSLQALKAFGNCLETWKSVQEFKDSKYSGPLRLRYKGRGANSKFSYIPFSADQLQTEISVWVSEGIDPSEIMICEAGPDGDVRIQGEVYTSHKGLELAYSLTPGLTCREAMVNPRRASGLASVMLLKKYMDAVSYDDLICLLQIYPDSVIEFTTFAYPVGWARRNTVFWEVRNY